MGWSKTGTGREVMPRLLALGRERSGTSYFYSFAPTSTHALSTYYPYLLPCPSFGLYSNGVCTEPRWDLESGSQGRCVCLFSRQYVCFYTRPLVCLFTRVFV